MGDQAVLGGAADQHHPLLVDTDDRRREFLAQGIRNNGTDAILPDTDKAVGSTQINAHYGHIKSLLLVCVPFKKYIQSRERSARNSCRGKLGKQAEGQVLSFAPPGTKPI